METDDLGALKMGGIRMMFSSEKHTQKQSNERAAIERKLNERLTEVSKSAMQWKDLSTTWSAPGGGLVDFRLNWQEQRRHR